MNPAPAKISLQQWDARYRLLRRQGGRQPRYGGPLGRHVTLSQDKRLERLQFDNSAPALRLWNLLLTENDRLREHRGQGRRLVGTMKDLGTLPVMVDAVPNLVAFYPDGAWWTPCLMEHSDGLLRVADRLGVDDSFCPVRAMLGAFATGAHFPLPDLLLCSAGAVCDDFSAVAQRLEQLGHPILWWEMPRRRPPLKDEPAVTLPGGLEAPRSQVAVVRSELERLLGPLGKLAGTTPDEAMLARSIVAANAVRRRISELRRLVFAADLSPLPALEMLIAEMLALHYCSDREETRKVLDGLLSETRRRIRQGQGVTAADAVRLFWINPVADLQAMNLVEECGGRICGTDYLFGHALVEIPEDLPPLEALARVALADPMVGSAWDRARMIAAGTAAWGSEAVVISRIPGASHCAWEGRVIREYLEAHCSIPIVELEVPPVCQGVAGGLRSRLEALMETARARRNS